jgi:hypothetical protein
LLTTTTNHLLPSHNKHSERHGGRLLLTFIFSCFITHNNRNIIMTWKDSLIDFTAGSVGGCSGKLLDYPLDTVKVRLQTQGAVTTEAVLTTTISAAAKSGKAAPPPIYYTGAIHCLQHTIRTDGYMSLYRGISAPLLGSMAENAVLFLVYSEIKKQMGETPGEPPLTLLQMCMAGGLAGGFTPFVLTPFELVKCRLQTVGQGFRTYKGPMDVVLQTIKEEGFFRGLYRGNMSTLLREIPGNFCWYGVYEGEIDLFGAWNVVWILFHLTHSLTPLSEPSRCVQADDTRGWIQSGFGGVGSSYWWCVCRFHSCRFLRLLLKQRPLVLYCTCPHLTTHNPHFLSQ